jgi:HlyD family secretion protein
MRTRSLIVLLLAAAACTKPAPPPVYQAVAVTNRDIVVSAQASGAIQPDTTVEVKTKASGEVLQILAETGQLVQRGQLLIRIDPRQAKNAVDQSKAALTLAQAQLDNAKTQLDREKALLAAQTVTQQEFEASQLAYATASADVVKARIDVENNEISLEDTDVKAPITGVIISKGIERGQVVASATFNAGGGTVLMSMADLNLVQVKTLVDETDIGKIKAGLPTSVTVDAYPNHPFEGVVLKIEPLAEVSQNVTMFPVLVRIDNRDGLLRPGMNTEVQIHVGRRDSVLAVPNAALRTQKDVASAAGVLGLSMETVQKQLADAKAAATPSGDTAASHQVSMGAGTGKPADSAAKAGATINTMTTQDGRVVRLPDGVTEAQVKAIFAKFRSGDTPTPAERAILQQMRQLNGGGNGGGGRQKQSSDYQFGGSYVAFLKTPTGPRAVPVKTGLTDLDYSEVLSGLKEGDSVLVLPSASLIASQAEFKNRIQSITGGGMPGMKQTTGAGAAAGGARAGAPATPPPAAPAPAAAPAAGK